MPDMLYTKLLHYSKEKENEILNQIQSSYLDIEKKRFLQLNFESMLKRSDSYQDTINMMVESYIEAFPESEYNDYIRHYIKYKFVYKWGAAIELFFGSSFLTGELKDRHKESVYIGGAIDIYYKKFEFILKLYGGSIAMRKDIEFSTGLYPKDSMLSVCFPEFSFGYTAFENHRVKLAPFAGVGGFFVYLFSLINMIPLTGKCTPLQLELGRLEEI